MGAAGTLLAGSAPLPLQLLATLEQDTVHWELGNTGRAPLTFGMWTCGVWDNFSSSAPDSLELRMAGCDKHACTARTLDAGGRLTGTLAVKRTPGGRGAASFRLGFKACNPDGTQPTPRGAPVKVRDLVGVFSEAWS